MPTELVYIPLDNERLTALARLSEATGRSVEELVQEAVSEFLAREVRALKIGKISDF
jgi:predicted transcriptional regulator